ncbi:mating-type m-specific polypeptide mc, partial [Basidiobolus meristosporus CBS 931.73]
KIPRPANCFFLFRREKQSEIFASNPGITNMEVSRIIGKMWKNISAEEKSKYQWMAEQIKLDHQQKYPDYKYSPNRTKTKRKQS